MKKVINISSNGIKQAIDDLVNENEILQDKVYKLEEQLQQKEKEIQDLKQKNDYLNDLEASAVEYKELKAQLQQKEKIIKEVREYITSQKLHKFQDTTGGLTYQEIKLLEILDKGE